MTVEETEKVDNAAKPILSKSWSEFSSHAPSYTGGKVTLCHTQGSKNLYGYEVTNEGSEESVTARSVFLLAPCAGDLSIIDAVRGIQARTIRRSINGENDGNAEDDDESLDTDAIVAYALAPNDCDLITAGRNNVLRHYDISGTPSHSYSGIDGKGPAKVRRVLGRSGHDLPISCMEFHSSGIFFATGSIDGNVKVWDLRGGYATHSFRYHAPGYTIGSRGGLRGSVTKLTWCPDITKLWLAVGRDDGTVRVHDLRTKEEQGASIVEMTDHVGAITDMIWASSRGSKGFDTFFTSGRDEVINTWSIDEVPCEGASSQAKTKKKKGYKGEKIGSTKTSYKRVHTLPLYESVEAMQLLSNFHHYSKSNEPTITIATAGSKGIIKVWQAKCKQNNADNSVKMSGLVCVAEQSSEAAFGQERGGYTGLLLTSNKHQLCQNSSDSEKEIDSPNYIEELIAIDAEHNFCFLNLVDVNLPLLGLNRTIVGHNDEILDLKIIPNQECGDDTEHFTVQNKKVVIATNSAQIRVFDLSSYSCDVLEGHTGIVLTLDVSPCGKFLVSSGKDKTTRLWDTRSFKCVAFASGHTEAIGATALSRKIGRYDVVGKAAENGAGSFLVTASKDKTLKRCNLPGSSVLEDISIKNQDTLSLSVFCSVRAHEKDINIVSVAPNDSFVATGSQDKTVKLWSSTDFALKGILKGHKRGVWDCQFSNHDRVIATCSGDKTIKLWSLTDFCCLRTFQGHSAGTLRVRFLSGGLQLMTCDGEGIIRLWNIRNNECTFSMDAHDNKIWALDVSSDGKMLVTGAADSRLKVFHDTTKELEQQNRQLEEQNILMEQKLANHLRHKEFEQALDIALDMDKPRQTLKVLTSIVENDLANYKDCLATLRRHVKNWDTRRITQILLYCREWNTRARNSHIAMLTLKAIFTSKAADELASINGISEILEGIVPYAERHFERIDKLYANSYLVDFTLASMGDLQTTSVDEYSHWEKTSNFVLPPKKVDGRVQIGGQAFVGFKESYDNISTTSSDNEVLTVGESDDDSDSELSMDDESSSHF
mmetsp:Transcript_4150/g.6040  ORF Transcript_4150/g.6040 Transcript_4150/m.6040 type:complete len:1049 (+) Transcript_4150:69-3215(+)